jgi:hypothetical protein
MMYWKKACEAKGMRAKMAFGRAATHREDNQHNHKSTLRHRARVLIVVLSKEEKCAETYLLNIHADEDGADRLGEEETASVVRLGLVVHPRVMILVQKVEEDKRCPGKAVDDRRDYHVADRDDGHKTSLREERAPSCRDGAVLDVIDRARR